MDVWFSIEEEPPPRGTKASWRDLKTFVSAPPKRVRRAFALLTRTYHGGRQTGSNLRTRFVLRSDRQSLYISSEITRRSSAHGSKCCGSVPDRRGLAGQGAIFRRGLCRVGAGRGLSDRLARRCLARARRCAARLHERGGEAFRLYRNAGRETRCRSSAIGRAGVKR